MIQASLDIEYNLILSLRRHNKHIKWSKKTQKCEIFTNIDFFTDSCALNQENL